MLSTVVVQLEKSASRTELAVSLGGIDVRWEDVNIAYAGGSDVSLHHVASQQNPSKIFLACALGYYGLLSLGISDSSARDDALQSP